MYPFAAVEVQLTAFFAVPVVDGQVVGIPFVAHDGQHAPWLVFQNLNAFAVRKLLLVA